MMQKALGTFIVLTLYALALLWVFEYPQANGLYASHVALYAVTAILITLAIWEVFKLKTWKISILVFLVGFVLADIVVFIKDVDPYAFAVRKQYSASFGVKNMPNLKTPVDFSSKKDGDILSIYNLNPEKLPEMEIEEERHKFEYRIDENGFRNSEADTKKEVIFIGDSLTIASSMETEKGWTAIAADAVGLYGYNLGVNQIGPENYARLLDHFGGESDYAVIAFFEGNDYDNLYYEVSPNFSKKHIWYWAEFFSKKPELVKKATIEPEDDFTVPTFEINGSKFPMLFYEHYANLLQRSENQLIGHSNYGQLKQSFADMGVACERHNLKCVMLYIPTKLRVYYPHIKDQLDLVKLYEDIKNPIVIYEREIEKNRNNQEAAVKKLLNESATNIEFVSATPLLEQEAGKGELVYYPYDTHLNQYGNKLVGEFVADKLNEVINK